MRRDATGPITFTIERASGGVVTINQPPNDWTTQFVEAIRIGDQTEEEPWAEVFLIDGSKWGLDPDTIHFRFPRAHDKKSVTLSGEYVIELARALFEIMEQVSPEDFERYRKKILEKL